MDKVQKLNSNEVKIRFGGHYYVYCKGKIQPSKKPVSTSSLGSYVPPKRQFVYSLHEATSQMITLVTTTVGISNPA
jgi:hypothetical protein